MLFFIFDYFEMILFLIFYYYGVLLFPFILYLCTFYLLTLFYLDSQNVLFLSQVHHDKARGHKLSHYETV